MQMKNVFGSNFLEKWKKKYAWLYHFFEILAEFVHAVNVIQL